MAEQDSAPEASQQNLPGESRPAEPGAARAEPGIPSAGDPKAPARRRFGKSSSGTGKSSAATGASKTAGRTAGDKVPGAPGTSNTPTGGGGEETRSGIGVGAAPAGIGGDTTPSGTGDAKARAGTRGGKPRAGIGGGKTSGGSSGDTAPAGIGGVVAPAGASGEMTSAGVGGKTAPGPGGERLSDRTGGEKQPVGRAPERAPAALVDLVRRGVLDETQLGAVVTALAEEPPRPTPARLLAEIAAYAGAGLLLSGLVLILAESWDDMAKVGRFVLFVLVALGLIVAGVATAGGRSVLFRPAWRRFPATGHTARTRLAAVLLALAAVSIAAAAGAVFDDGNVSTDTTWVYAAAAGLVAAAVGYAALPSLLGLLVCAGFSAAAVSGLLGEVLGIDGDLTGLGVLVLGFGWLGLSRLRAVLEVWAGYVAGVVLAVAGAQMVDVFDEMRLAYVLTAVVSVVCFAVYATDRSWVLSLGGAAALTLAAVEAVADWTGESAGASGAILVVGAVVLGIGSYLLTRSAKNAT
ncbi:DUF2157 domain-containing protein [Nocardia sp. NPDC051750]|uniref:DUF2157 domain-containing protein n=1 Tax=Nocardia sp. NPDC051750 TaxID=3364325 RepID=UPI00379B647C